MVEEGERNIFVVDSDEGWRVLPLMELDKSLEPVTL